MVRTRDPYLVDYDDSLRQNVGTVVHASCCLVSEGSECEPIVHFTKHVGRQGFMMKTLVTYVTYCV